MQGTSQRGRVASHAQQDLPGEAPWHMGPSPRAAATNHGSSAAGCAAVLANCAASGLLPGSSVMAVAIASSCTSQQVLSTAAQLLPARSARASALHRWKPSSASSCSMCAARSPASTATQVACTWLRSVADGAATSAAVSRLLSWVARSAS